VQQGGINGGAGGAALPRPAVQFSPSSKTEKRRKNMKKGWWLLLLTLVIALVALATWAYAAEKREQTYLMDNFRTGYKSAVMIRDVPNHEVGQELTITDIRYSDPDFRTKECWVYIQFNYVAGSGPHRGTYIYRHEDGTQTYGTFEGTQKTVVNTDGSWVATWEGKYQYLGGTGKYKNIKGTGTYKGRVSSTEAPREEGWEVIEY
jgi:hypothetical protein